MWMEQAAQVSGEHQPHLELAHGVRSLLSDPGNPIDIYHLNRNPESSLQNHPLGNREFTAMKDHWEGTR